MINQTTQLKTSHRMTSGMPASGTVAEIVAAAKRIFRKYHSTRVATYGGGKQVEVRCTRDGYHGRDLKLVAAYEIVE